MVDLVIRLKYIFPYVEHPLSQNTYYNPIYLELSGISKLAIQSRLYVMLDGHWAHTDRQVDLLDFDLVSLAARKERRHADNQQLKNREVEDLLGWDVAVVNGDL